MSSLQAPTPDPGNAVIAHALHWLAVVLEIEDGEPQLISAYRHAAQVVRQLDQPCSELVRAQGATGLERLGVKAAIAGSVSEWVRTGELPVFAEPKKKDQGLWPTLTNALCKTLGIERAPKVARPGARRSGWSASLKRPIGPLHRQVWESWN
ncbi:MAG: hypothetical protein IPJ65_43510 [Archangiaceae bacterium]|nr:hypothetical protein [Archangiaceae bacterium]